MGLQRCLSTGGAQPSSIPQFSVPPTARERQVLELLVRGSSNKEIACALSCSVRTAECHVARLLEKTGADSRAVLIASVLGNERGLAGSTGAGLLGHAAGVHAREAVAAIAAGRVTRASGRVLRDVRRPANRARATDLPSRPCGSCWALPVPSRPPRGRP
ncbi:MAG: helix-turn-helix transcriptional regulator [Deltaproteobacteria bacterium]|nr:helix-turn-helix transcriptional regulator [Deltaproteobacteria bacterium]